MKIHLTSTSNLNPGEREFYMVKETEIALINHQGEFHAIRNSCPHMEGPVGKGKIWENTKRINISCPWHGWKFELESGRSASHNSCSLQRYDLLIDDGEIFLKI